MWNKNSLNSPQRVRNKNCGLMRLMRLVTNLWSLGKVKVTCNLFNKDSMFQCADNTASSLEPNTTNTFHVPGWRKNQYETRKKESTLLPFNPSTTKQIDSSQLMDLFSTSVLKSHTTTNLKIATVSSLQELHRSKWKRWELSEKGASSYNKQKFNRD